MQDKHVNMPVSVLIPLETQNLRQPIRIVIRLGPTPLKLDGVEKNILRVALKDSRSRSYPHTLKHQRAPSGSTYGCSPHEALGSVIAL